MQEEQEEEEEEEESFFVFLGFGGGAGEVVWEWLLGTRCRKRQTCIAEGLAMGKVDKQVYKGRARARARERGGGMVSGGRKT